MVNVFPAASAEGQEENLAVQTSELVFLLAHPSSTVGHQLDGRQHVVTLNVGDYLVHHPGKKEGRKCFI